METKGGGGPECGTEMILVEGLARLIRSRAVRCPKCWGMI